MVGDTEYDLAMAAAVGMPSVGVSYGSHSPERLGLHDPLAVIDALPELIDLAESDLPRFPAGLNRAR